MTAPVLEEKSVSRCSNYVHYRLILDTSAERCPSCGRLLIRKPDWKCEHGGMRVGCSLCNPGAE